MEQTATVRASGGLGEMGAYMNQTGSARYERRRSALPDQPNPTLLRVIIAQTKMYV
jgi:hypothetical protein